MSSYPQQHYKSRIREACEAGNLDLLKFLVTVEAFQNLKNDALCYGAINEHFDLVKYLVSIGGDVNACYNYLKVYCHPKTTNQIIKFLEGELVKERRLRTLQSIT